MDGVVGSGDDDGPRDAGDASNGGVKEETADGFEVPDIGTKGKKRGR